MVARHYNGGKGVFAYQAFDHINATHFAGRLPEPLILWDITEHGRCLGWCRSQSEGPPVIKLHPAIIQPATNNPWGLNPDLLGVCFAYDVLLHECIHESVDYLLGGNEGADGTSARSCHASPAWIAECNRIGRLLGHPDIRIEKSQALRDGKRVYWGNRGDADPARFPYTLPGREWFHMRNELPFPLDDEGYQVPGSVRRYTPLQQEVR